MSEKGTCVPSIAAAAARHLKVDLVAEDDDGHESKLLRRDNLVKFGLGLVKAIPERALLQIVTG